MEAAIYLSDLLATLLLMYWAVRNADQPAGAPSVGLFAYRETLKPEARPRVDNAATTLSHSGSPRPEVNGQPVATTRGGWRQTRRRDAGRHPGWQDRAR